MHFKASAGEVEPDAYREHTRKKSWHAGQAWQLLQPPFPLGTPLLHLSSSYLQQTLVSFACHPRCHFCCPELECHVGGVQELPCSAGGVMQLHDISAAGAKAHLSAKRPKHLEQYRVRIASNLEKEGERLDQEAI